MNVHSASRLAQIIGLIRLNQARRIAKSYSRGLVLQDQRHGGRPGTGKVVGPKSIDILGGGPAVHYPSAYREFDGIMVPTRRRVYVRNPDGTPVRDSVSIAIDIADVTFR
jgi:hypothetical protein